MIAVDFLLNYYLGKEYGPELLKIFNSYLGQTMSHFRLQQIDAELTHFLRDKLEQTEVGGFIINELNPYVSVDLRHDSEINIKFGSNQATRVIEGFFG